MDFAVTFAFAAFFLRTRYSGGSHEIGETEFSGILALTRSFFGRHGAYYLISRGIKSFEIVKNKLPG